MGVDGEIEAKVPWLFKGYKNLDSKTAEAFTKDGFFKTGLVVHVNLSRYKGIFWFQKSIIKVVLFWIQNNL